MKNPTPESSPINARLFERHAERYDKWFDSPDGKAIFAAKVACLQKLLPRNLEGWVEVGVVSRRFASALGIREGIDPSKPMLDKAGRLGIITRQATAENLPYPTASLSGILPVVTLCFLENPEKATQEFARVLNGGGQLLVGLCPPEAVGGKSIRRKGNKGIHSILQHASTPAGKQGCWPQWQASTLSVQPVRFQRRPAKSGNALPLWKAPMNDKAL